VRRRKSPRPTFCCCQWRDIVSVLRVSGEAMADAYRDAWASGVNLGALLQQARTARSPEH